MSRQLRFSALVCASVMALFALTSTVAAPGARESGADSIAAAPLGQWSVAHWLAD